MRFVKHQVKNYSAAVRRLRLDIPNGTKLNAFHQFIQTIEIMGRGNSKYNEPEYYFNRRSEFKQLETLIITCLIFEYLKLEEMREMLDKVEYLEIDACTTSQIFTEKIPILFPNLKRLTMRGLHHERDVVIDIHYLKLKRFEINYMCTETVALGSLLERNLNIHKLAVDSTCLWDHRESIKAAKLEDLAIDIEGLDLFRNFATFYQLLNELHERESYQRLKLRSTIYRIRNKWIELASLPALVGLTILRCLNIRFGLSIFRNLEEICIQRSYLINDIEAMSDNLVNLERIRFGYADLDDIMTIIKRAKNLSKIKVTKFIRVASCGISKTTERVIYAGPGNEFNRCFKEQEQKVNLSSLNTERAKLSDAKMITLYLTEEVYLTTKRVMNEFIQLRRFQSSEWDHGFDEIIMFAPPCSASIFEPPSR